ncbi:hypothetical protein AB1Y20_020182 [Prymnesium parvum]|uniref:Uncharacterized protein n=1 Tax=Prymnesium parvum TaxID=97485 RepID=A0AB34JTX6_PRYPA
MVPGECLMLQPLEKAGEVASLVAKQGCTYLVVHSSSGAQEEVLLDEADQKLTGRFMLPAASKAELASADAAAVRAREAREALASREKVKKAAVEAATLRWYQEQAALGLELGISYVDWLRIVKLLTNAPPCLEGGHIVMNSVAAGRAMIVDAAIERALGEPLRESVRFAKARAAEQDAAKGRPREKGLDQETWAGKDVTEMIPELEKQAEEALRKAAAQKQKKEETTLNQTARRAQKIKQACRNMISGRAQGDVSKLAIQDLLTLISWKDGTPPENKSAANKEAIVKVWSDLNVPMDVIRAEAAVGAEDDTTTARKRKPAATTNQQKKKRSQQTADSSDEDESGIDEDGDGQSDTDEDGSDSEDDSDDEDDEPTWNEEGGGCGQEEEEVA